MKTLLILEEGGQLTRAIGPTFEKAGYEVITYRDPTGVLVMAKQIQADVMVIDANLRSHGAVSALRSFGRNVHTAGIPAIALVGRTGPRAEALREAGAVATAGEPPNANEIFALVERHRLEGLDFSQPAASTAPSPATPSAGPPASPAPSNIPHQAPADVLAEPARLEALEAARVFDTAPEPAYDTLTRLASSFLSVPVSLASFVGADRQFFKAEIGLEGKWKERRGTPLSHSFCQWVVSSREPVIVDDARRHRVLRSNAAVQDLGVVAYAGVPVMGQGAQPIGSMCAIDHVDRNWTAHDIETLQDLALILQACVTPEPQRSRDAIEAASRLLVRHGARAGTGDRADLVRIIEDQSRRL